MSKTNGDNVQDLEVYEYPTIRLYKGPGDYEEYDDDHPKDYDGFIKFLTENGVKI